jgi:hypothetical protein
MQLYYLIVRINVLFVLECFKLNLTLMTWQVLMQNVELSLNYVLSLPSPQDTYEKH